MPKVPALKQNVEFHRAYSRGKSRASSALVTYALKNKSRQCRIGITTSKKIGNAVERNRSRRVIRAAFSSLKDECSGGWDIVFVARYKTKSLKSTDVASIMHKQLTELGIIGTDRGDAEWKNGFYLQSDFIKNIFLLIFRQCAGITRPVHNTQLKQLKHTEPSKVFCWQFFGLWDATFSSPAATIRYRPRNRKTRRERNDRPLSSFRRTLWLRTQTDIRKHWISQLRHIHHPSYSFCKTFADTFNIQSAKGYGKNSAYSVQNP